MAGYAKLLFCLSICGSVAWQTAPACADPTQSGGGQRLIDMPIRMSITSLAKARSTALSFWYPEGQLEFDPPALDKAVTADRKLSVRGVLILDRSTAMTALVTPPDSPILISCPGGTVTIGPFTASTKDGGQSDDCSKTGTSTCTYEVAGAAHTSKAMTPVACTAGSANFTVQYQ